MFVAWIAITLMLALVVATISAGVSRDDRLMSFVIAFVLVCQISLFIGFVYVAGHFITKYW